MKFKKKTFKNGMRLIMVPMKESQTVTVMVVVEAGASYEEKKLEGISHFLEHVTFKGTAKRPTSFHINHELDSIGSRSNAFTAHEYTSYYAKAHPKHIEKIIDVLSDIYLNSTFPEAEIEREKGVIIEEINMYEDIPQRRAPYLFLKLLYGEQSAGSDVLGKKEIIKKISRDDFLEYRKKHYVAEGTVILVSGSFNEKKVAKQIAASFKRISKDKKHKKSKTIERQNKPGLAIHYKKTDQTHLVLGVRTWPGNDKRNVILELISVILTEGMSSRLFQKLREEMGVGYYVRSENDEYTDHGYFAVSVGADKGRVPEVISAILQEFRKLKTDIISEAELVKVKDYYIGTMHLGLESSDEIGGFYVAQEVVNGKMETPEEIEKKILSVTADDIKKVAEEIFRDKNLNLAIIGDLKDDEKIRSILKIDL